VNFNADRQQSQNIVVTDIEICQSDLLYPFSDAGWGALWPEGSDPEATDLPETTMMTIEILHLTEQIQRWLNLQVARHLAAQAAKLAR
jgi:hypothetical protein